MLKKIGIAALVLILVLIAVVAMQPSEFQVARSATMAAGPAAIFDQVNDLHRWPSWSPWEELDPNVRYTYQGPASGQGAAVEWEGNQEVGKGRMKIIESQPAERIRIQLDFLEPFAASNIAQFTFRPQGDATEVTWTMSGRNNFLAKAAHLVMDMEAMIGKDFEKGLAQMKALVETPPADLPEQ